MIDPNRNVISKSLLAGISISIGCFLLLSCEYVLLGYLLFSIGFVCCNIFDLNLFTDKCCTISDGQDFRRLILVILLNIFAAFIFGLLSNVLDPTVSTSADNILKEHISNDYLQCIIKSIITGFLLTVAVKSEMNDEHSHIIYALCVIGFVSTGCLHCIAESFYYGASSMIYSNTGDLLFRLLIIVVFNFIGSNMYNLFVNKSLIHKS